MRIVYDSIIGTPASPKPKDVMPESTDDNVSDAAQLGTTDTTNDTAIDPIKTHVPRDPLADGRRALHKESTPVYKFVLTGGPCAGKTSALARMSAFFKEKG